MQIKFNGTQVETKSVTLLQFLQSQGLENKSGIAVAVNQHVIQKQKWSDQKLSDNDDILVITAAAGG